jgi:hypothetical protein
MLVPFRSTPIGSAIAALLLAVAPAFAGYNVYFLDQGKPLDVPTSLRGLSEGFRSTYGTATPSLGSVWSITAGMPARFRNRQYCGGDCGSVGSLDAEGVEVHFYRPETDPGGTQYMALALKDRDIEWLFTIVRAHQKALDAGFSTDHLSLDLVLAFASRIASPGNKGYVKAKYRGPAIDRFIQAIKNKSLADTTDEALVRTFRGAVRGMAVYAGMWWGNDGARELADRAADLLQAAKDNPTGAAAAPEGVGLLGQ